MKTKCIDYRFYILLLLVVLIVFTDGYPIHRPIYFIYSSITKTELLPYIGLNKTLVANSEIANSIDTYEREYNLLESNSINPIPFDYYLLRSIALKYQCKLDKPLNCKYYELKGSVRNIHSVLEYIDTTDTNVLCEYKEVPSLENIDRIIVAHLYVTQNCNSEVSNARI